MISERTKTVLVTDKESAVTLGQWAHDTSMGKRESENIVANPVRDTLEGACLGNLVGRCSRFFLCHCQRKVALGLFIALGGGPFQPVNPQVEVWC
jgi:hypothetical protein